MKSKRKSRRLKLAVGQAPRRALDAKAFIDPDVVVTVVGVLLTGLLDGTNRRRVPDSGSWPSILPTDYMCIAEREQALLYEYFFKRAHEHEQAVLRHVRHCDHCRETVKMMAGLKETLSKENCLHGGTGTRVGVLTESAEAETV